MDMRIREPARNGSRRWPWSRDDARPEMVGAPEAVATPGFPPPPGPPPGSPPRTGRTRWWWFKRGLAAFVLLFLAMVLWLAITAPLSKSLEPVAPPQLTLLAADGTPIARNGAVVEAPVEVKKLPPHVVDAFLSIEDRGFYDHWGISLRGMARAAFANMTGGSTQGGSTITQQLAKFTFLTPEQSLTRKAREALIAFWLETWLTKDEILERYLSNAYFGDNVYGLRAASLHYFYRQPEKLKVEQAAMLAGMLKAPTRLAPTRNYALSEKRMRVVLAAMVENGKLDAKTARSLPSPRPDVRTVKDLPTGTYFADWALPIARRNTEAGYAKQTLTTTLDSRLQGIARRVVARAPLGQAEVALVAMRPNGEVVAMVGGKDYAKSPFNRATQAKRQPGSTFKLFVWLAALDAGWEPGDTIANTEITTGGYRPKNAGGRYSPAITLEEAFARSSNVAAVRLYNEVGDEAVIDMARAFGVRAILPRGDPSVALGTATMTLLDLTSAYAGVAGNAFPVTPTAFRADEPGWWDSLFNGKDSLSSGEHEAMERMLRRAINSGTGRAATLSAPNFGKTGTSQDNRDALFVGYAKDLVVGVWVGNDDNTPLNGISGGGLPARIWRDFMSEAIGARTAPSRPKPKPSVDPEGPVEPLDLPELPAMPDLGDIPIGEGNSRFRMRDGQAVITTEINGVPVDLTVGRDGVRINGEDVRAVTEAGGGALAQQLRRETERRAAEPKAEPPPR